MYKNKIISIILIFVIIGNIIFPNISHANNEIKNIEQAKIAYEQEIINEGETLRTSLEARYPEYDSNKINAIISANLSDRKGEIANRVAVRINDKDVRKEFIREYNQLGEIYISAKYGAVTTANKIFDFFGVVLDGIGGALTYYVRVKWLILPASIIQLIGTGLASTGTTNTDNVPDEENIYYLALDSIFFNKVALLDINLLDYENAGPTKLDENNVIYKIRKNVAGWYYSIRNLAIVFGLLTLIYIGIRMAISSISSEKAKYKKMLLDWFVSIVLIFTLHYIIAFTLTLNNQLVKILDDARKTVATQLDEERKTSGEILSISKFIDSGQVEKTLQVKLQEMVLDISFTKGTSASIIYLMIMVMTLLFLIVYLKRVAVISFLIIISPFITITYSIDKVREW